MKTQKDQYGQNPNPEDHEIEMKAVTIICTNIFHFIPFYSKIRASDNRLTIYEMFEGVSHFESRLELESIQ